MSKAKFSDDVNPSDRDEVKKEGIFQRAITLTKEKIEEATTPPSPKGNVELVMSHDNTFFYVKGCPNSNFWLSKNKPEDEDGKEQFVRLAFGTSLLDTAPRTIAVVPVGSKLAQMYQEACGDTCSLESCILPDETD